MGCTASTHAASSKVEPREEPQEFHSKYLVSDKIGRGAFAQVHLAIKKRSSGSKSGTGVFAVKVRTLRNVDSKQDKKLCISSFSEVCLWSQVGSHPNCVRMHESFFDDDLCYMVMEKCNCSLTSHIENMLAVSERSLSKIFAQMMEGIAHMHSKDLVHRDIKFDNFLIGKDGNTVKLCDFGVAAYVPEGKKAKGVCGTAPYMCPEMLLNRECDRKADIWSLGCIVHLLFTGKLPYMTPDRTARGMKDAIKTGEPPKCERSWLTWEAQSFLTRLLDRDPLTRISASDALRMPFITRSGDQGESHYTSLKPMLQVARCTGAFDQPNLHETSCVDAVLSACQMGRAERKANKILVKSQINDFFVATPEKIEELVKAFWQHDCIDACQDPTLSSESTSCGSSRLPSSPYTSRSL